MKTTYRYLVKSAVEVNVVGVKSLFLDDCKIVLKTDKKKFLKGIEIHVPGNITETQGKAHKIAKYITDVFIMNYSVCDLQKFQVYEVSENDDEKMPKHNQYIVNTYFSCRKVVGSQKELEQEINSERFNQYSDVISAFVDGLRAISMLERYVNFYKVIEFTFAPRNGSTENDLKKENRLRKLIAKHKGVNNNDEDKIIKDLVSLRHECSHLNLKKREGDSPQKKGQVSSVMKFKVDPEKVD